MAGPPSTRPMAVPAWTRSRSPATAGATRVMSTSSQPDAVRRMAPLVAVEGLDLPEAALVGAGDADLRRTAPGPRAAEQAGVLEADMGQLPEQVVHAAPGRRSRGPRRRRRPATARDRPHPARGGGRPRSRWSSAPQARARRTTERAVGSSAVAITRMTSPTSTRRPQRRHRVGVGHRFGRQAPVCP